MSLRRPTAPGIATKQGLLDILVGLYDAIQKPNTSGNINIIKSQIAEAVSFTGTGALASFASYELVQRTTGVEAYVAEFSWPFNAGAVPKATLDLSAAFYAISASGTAQFFLRIGGSAAADGVVVGASAWASATEGSRTIAGTVPNPGGVVPVKLTIASSAPSVAAKVRGLHVLVN